MFADKASLAIQPTLKVLDAAEFSNLCRPVKRFHTKL